MKIDKLLHIDISDENGNLESSSFEVSIDIEHKDIKLFFIDGENEKIFLMNINRTVSFLKSIPDDIYRKITRLSLNLIIKWFENWLNKLKEIEKCQH